MDLVQAFLQSNALAPPAFEPTSRYYGIATAQMTGPDGRTVVYAQRRFLPPPENFAPLQVITNRPVQFRIYSKRRGEGGDKTGSLTA